MPFAATWMGLGMIMLKEVSQRKTFYRSPIVESKRVMQMNSSTEQKQAHRHINQM